MSEPDILMPRPPAPHKITTQQINIHCNNRNNKWQTDSDNIEIYTANIEIGNVKLTATTCNSFHVLRITVKLHTPLIANVFSLN